MFRLKKDGLGAPLSAALVKSRFEEFKSFLLSIFIRCYRVLLTDDHCSLILLIVFIGMMELVDPTDVFVIISKIENSFCPYQDKILVLELDPGLIFSALPFLLSIIMNKTISTAYYYKISEGLKSIGLILFLRNMKMDYK